MSSRRPDGKTHTVPEGSRGECGVVCDSHGRRSSCTGSRAARGDRGCGRRCVGPVTWTAATTPHLRDLKTVTRSLGPSFPGLKHED